MIEDGYKFCKLSPELWPLIDVKNSFPLSILSIFRPIFFKLCIRVDIMEIGLGLKMSKFRQLSQESLPLIDFKICFRSLS